MSQFINLGSGDIRDNVILNIAHLNITTPGHAPGAHTFYLLQSEIKSYRTDPLAAHVVYEAMHDSGEVNEQGHCYPGTRVLVQQVIKRWVDDRHPDFLITGLLGAAGAGKSAIMRTVAKTLDAQGLLLGSFFCLRGSTRRNDAQLVIPTLVDQIIQHVPSLHAIVQQAFDDTPGLLSKTMKLQATRLIIEPLNSVEPSERDEMPHVILLDGLDEINGVPAQQEILKLLAFINDCLVFPLHILIASRPEPPIREAFDEHMGRHWTPLDLDGNFKPDEDIHIFYVAHFRDIRERHPHLKLASAWPGDAVRRKLVVKGSGQFIFASVVVAVVGDPTSTFSPQERLDIILEVVKRNDLRPLERLDLLYVSVFHQIPEADRAEVLLLLAIILKIGSPDFRTPQCLDAVFCYPSGTTRQRLRHLHSVLEIPKEDDGEFRSLHATLGDFVFDKSRSERFLCHVDKTVMEEEFYVRLVRSVLTDAPRIVGEYSHFGP